MRPEIDIQLEIRGTKVFNEFLQKTLFDYNTNWNSILLVLDKIAEMIDPLAPKLVTALNEISRHGTIDLSTIEDVYYAALMYIERKNEEIKLVYEFTGS